MRVLHIISDLSGGGAGVCLRDFVVASNQLDQCHDVLTVGRVSYDEIDTKGLTIYESRGSMDDAVYFIAHGHYDIFHWHWWEDMPLMRLVKDIPGKRIVECDVYPCEPVHTLTESEIGYADVVVVDGRDTLEAYPQIPNKRFIIGGANLDPYLNAPKQRLHTRIGRGSVLDCCASAPLI